MPIDAPSPGEELSARSAAVFNFFARQSASQASPHLDEVRGAAWVDKVYYVPWAEGYARSKARALFDHVLKVDPQRAYFIGEA